MLGTRAFESADFKLQNEMIKVAEIKEDAKLKLIKKLMPYVTDSGGVIFGSKKRKKIPHSTKTVEDSRTGKKTMLTSVEL